MEGAGLPDGSTGRFEFTTELGSAIATISDELETSGPKELTCCIILESDVGVRVETAGGSKMLGVAVGVGGFGEPAVTGWADDITTGVAEVVGPPLNPPATGVNMKGGS